MMDISIWAGICVCVWVTIMTLSVRFGAMSDADNIRIDLAGVRDERYKEQVERAEKLRDLFEELDKRVEAEKKLAVAETENQLLRNHILERGDTALIVYMGEIYKVTSTITEEQDHERDYPKRLTLEAAKVGGAKNA